MIKIYSRLDKLLNVSVCVHFPSKKVCVVLFFASWDNRPAGLGQGLKISYKIIWQIVEALEFFLKPMSWKGDTIKEMSHFTS